MATILPEDQLSNLARALVLSGGVILLIAGMIDFAGGNVSAYINSPLVGLERGQEGLLAILAGIISLSGYRQLHVIGWGAVLLVLGIIIGGLGGILILVAGLVSIVTVHAKTPTG